MIDRDHIRRHADHGTGPNLRFQMRYSSRDAVSIWFFLNRIQHAEILCGILGAEFFDLYRRNDTILINDKVDLLLVAVTVEIQQRLRFSTD